MAEKQMDQSQARRRRRDGSSGVQQRLCTHCGRSFKRSEHLERHVRTHTKEKPYVCHCGSAYSRRDLLTRHQRITHETLSPRSPDAPASEDNHQLASTDSDPPSEDAAVSSTASMPDMSMNHSLQQHQFSNTSHDFGIHNHPASQPYHQLITGQEYFDNGQNFTGFDHLQEFHNFSDGPGLPPEWSPYYHDPNLEQDMVDPALRGSMVDISSPIGNENFSAHAYNPWMSPAAQKWGN
ncbi:hypothetical protein F4804DRAFT_31201 [Jackrogersella minutella]|nr:hypothetical protein F4804DRAFT_31201 [Jackrogersella minutella]